MAGLQWWMAQVVYIVFNIQRKNAKAHSDGALLRERTLPWNRGCAPLLQGIKLRRKRCFSSLGPDGLVRCRANTPYGLLRG